MESAQLSQNGSHFKEANKKEYIHKITKMKKVLQSIRGHMAGMMASVSPENDTIDINPNQNQKSKRIQLNKHMAANIVNILEFRANNREIQTELENMRKFVLKKKGEMDETNLQLQSLIYEKNHLLSEINGCKSYKTPQLDLVLQNENQVISNDIVSTDSAAYQKTLDFLNQELLERKNFDSEYANILTSKKELEAQLTTNHEIIEDLPNMLNKIEEASISLFQNFSKRENEDNQPLQNQKDEDLIDLPNFLANNTEGADMLPSPLFNLYWKFTSFVQAHSQFGVQVKIIGDKSDTTIEQSYKKYWNKTMMYNQQMANKISRPKQSSEEDNKQNEDKKAKKMAIMETSKKIKKKNKKKSSKHRILDEMKEVELLIGKDQFSSERKKLPRFPLGLRIEMEKNSKIIHSLFPHSSIEKFVDLSIPELNLLVCSGKSSNKNISTNELLSYLFENDVGQHVCQQLKQSNLYWNEENQVPYSWIHFLSGYYKFGFSFANEIVPISNRENGDLITPEDILTNQETHYLYNPRSVTTSSFLHKVHQRALALEILIFQIDHILKFKSVPSEIGYEIRKIKEFKALRDKVVLVSAEEISEKSYFQEFRSEGNEFDYTQLLDVAYEQTEEGKYVLKYTKYQSPEGSSFLKFMKLEFVYNTSNKLQTLVAIPFEYPIKAPKFTLKLTNIQKDKFDGNQFPDELKSVVQEKDLSQLKHINIKNYGYSEILQQIENELHAHSEEFCSSCNKFYLLSFQIRKLEECFQIFIDLENEKKSSTYSNALKGLFRSKPFKYNEEKGIFEER